MSPPPSLAPLKVANGFMVEQVRRVRAMLMASSQQQQQEERQEEQRQSAAGGNGYPSTRPTGASQRRRLEDKYMSECVHDEEIAHLLGLKGMVASQAALKLQRMVSYRVENDLISICPETVEGMAKLGRMYLSKGRGRKGQAVVVLSLRQWYSDSKMAVRMLCYYLDRAMKLMQEEGRTSRWLWVVDLEDFGISSIPPIATLNDLSEILGLLYPQRVEHLFLCQAGFLITQALDLLMLQTSERTRTKMTICDNVAESFAHFIDKDQLESRFGGKLGHKYKFYQEEAPFRKPSKLKVPQPPPQPQQQKQEQQEEEKQEEEKQKKKQQQQQRELVLQEQQLVIQHQLVLQQQKMMKQRQLLQQQQEQQKHPPPQPQKRRQKLLADLHRQLPHEQPPPPPPPPKVAPPAQQPSVKNVPEQKAKKLSSSDKLMGLFGMQSNGQQQRRAARTMPRPSGLTAGGAGAGAGGGGGGGGGKAAQKRPWKPTSPPVVDKASTTSADPLVIQQQPQPQPQQQQQLVIQSLSKEDLAPPGTPPKLSRRPLQSHKRPLLDSTLPNAAHVRRPMTKSGGGESSEGAPAAGPSPAAAPASQHGASKVGAAAPIPAAAAKSAPATAAGGGSAEESRRGGRVGRVGGPADDDCSIM